MRLLRVRALPRGDEGVRRRRRRRRRRLEGAGSRSRRRAVAAEFQRERAGHDGVREVKHEHGRGADHRLLQWHPEDAAEHRRRPVGSTAEDGDFGYGQARLHEAVPDGAHLYRVDAHRVPNAHVPTEVLAEEFLLHRAGEQLREPAHEDADDGGSPEAHGVLHRADDEDAAGEVHGRTWDRGQEEHAHAEDEEADDHHPGVEFLHDRDHVSEEEHRALADAHVAHEIEDGDVTRPS
mmetsp:Transcript_9388/g.38010  ORF Transcript_9388/g.38010 Transcript_9388/m.38010 type:complete len:236 (-) Transcript_9388:1390-2097(-)